ncbi:hypothetical protein LPC08_02695 [Roseomonas sp. OT10]|uniref:hypothetical protein n=1 Tax=Roseomonas cutis TaxID=2897332 RepID=UPI001E435855|nr:hypothetical protein [Roseomonas sp. OT10]UFN49571.1 hypothetical protein LPC08_02695 [Roseomonas sp. OT10]
MSDDPTNKPTDVSRSLPTSAEAEEEPVGNPASDAAAMAGADGIPAAAGAGAARRPQEARPGAGERRSP